MARQLSIVGLGGSVAAPSRSLAALELALESAREAGAQTTLFDLHRLELPIYDPTVRTPGESAQQLIETPRTRTAVPGSPFLRGLSAQASGQVNLGQHRAARNVRFGRYRIAPTVLSTLSSKDRAC
jgi:hypothetical protein